MTPLPETMPQAVTVDGQSYPVVHVFTATRAIIAMGSGGTYPYALVDRDELGEWNDSGDPPRNADEKAVLDALEAPHLGETDVVVTRDDDT